MDSQRKCGAFVRTLNNCNIINNDSNNNNFHQQYFDE